MSKRFHDFSLLKCYLRGNALHGKPMARTYMPYIAFASASCNEQRLKNA